jgi:hypothetical protein
MPDAPADEFVDSIPFAETQAYVKRILGTADDYRRLYDGGALDPFAGLTDRAPLALARAAAPGVLAPVVKPAAVSTKPTTVPQTRSAKPAAVPQKRATTSKKPATPRRRAR